MSLGVSQKCHSDESRHVGTEKNLNFFTENRFLTCLAADRSQRVGIWNDSKTIIKHLTMKIITHTDIIKKK
jgi:hypothetical protein